MGEHFEVVYRGSHGTGSDAAQQVAANEDTSATVYAGFASRVIQNYKSAQDTYWAATNDGKTHAETLRTAMRSALEAEAGIRVSDGTLSPAAYRTVEQLWTRPGASLPSVRPRLETSRLTMHGETVPGAFVLAGRRADAQQESHALLWRPGRPLQEFSSVQALRQWVADERPQPTGGGHRGSVDDVGTLPVSEDVIALRQKDLRTLLDDRVTQALGFQLNAEKLQQYFDNSPDAAQYLDLSRTWEADVTEGLRSRLSGPDAPAQSLKFEEAWQDAMTSREALESELESIPSMSAFAANAVADHLAEQYPDAARVDPDKTVVHTRNVKLRITSLPPKIETRVLSTKDYTLTEYALRNAQPWQALTARDVTLGVVIDGTSERASATLTDSSGNPVAASNGDPLELDTEALESVAMEVDAGKRFTDMLKERLSPSSGTKEQQVLQELWTDAMNNRMRAERYMAEVDPTVNRWFQTSPDPVTGRVRALDYIDAVVEHPNPEHRPKVAGHRIVANNLVLGATTNTNRGGQTINGVIVIGSDQPAASPAVVLYTPNAPDNIPFRELSDIGEMDTLLQDPSWRSYFSERMSTSDTAEISRILDVPAKRRLQTSLNPIEGNLYDAMYRSAIGFQIAHAQHRSTTSDQVRNQSLNNQVAYGIDLAFEVASILPLGKAAKATQAVRRNLAKRLKTQPRLGSATANVLPRGGAATVVSPGSASAATPPPSWRLNDQAAISRFQPGNRGPGGVHYQRDPTNGKEYLKIDGSYYRGE